MCGCCVDLVTELGWLIDVYQVPKGRESRTSARCIEAKCVLVGWSCSGRALDLFFNVFPFSSDVLCFWSSGAL